MDRFEDVVAAELPGLLRYATALSGDPHQAHDIVQEVLTRAYVRWETVGGADRPNAYLMTMVTNEFLSWRRRWHTRTVATLGPDVIEHSTPPGRDHSEDVAERDDLDRRLARLPRRQQAALVLRFYQGLDYAESAQVLGCAEGTVRSAVSRGLATLRLEAGPVDRRAPAPLTRTETP
ncbi:RNA polymerase sigma factor [uncultured Jatrophihabitans sp.]|uniref:RNA polymerase sigma factor n=1 Tax=uncultured Jatrophihabitans sp. TaxID=1610747 RepID=UPI0035CAD58C